MYDIIDKIIEVKDALPKKQQKLCNYLIINYEQASMLTVAELAKNAGVGSTTVMRLLQMLGQSSFGAFKKELLNSALIRTTTSYRVLKENFTTIETEQGNNTFYKVANDGIQVLGNLCTPTNTAQFQKMSDMLCHAEKIFTLGIRSTKIFALYCEYSINAFCPHVIQLSNEPDFIYDKITLYMKPTDVLLAFSPWPCSRKTIEVVEYCHKLGIPIALVTNTSLNPLVKIAQAVIDTNSVNHPSADMVFIAVIQALVAELGRRTAPNSTENLEQIEAVLNEKQLIL